RTLTGAWIETADGSGRRGRPRVAPSRVRGLKPDAALKHEGVEKSHPHGCVD
ncbi:hypothetical protein HMPREF3038_02710, partial [Akkermansia sp. KLE1797]